MHTATCAVFLNLLSFLPCQVEVYPPLPEPIQPQPGVRPETPAPLPGANGPQVVDGGARPIVFPWAGEVSMARVLRTGILGNLPHDLVVEKQHDWGHQAHVPSIQGVRVIEVMRNHGNWEKMRILCRDLPHRLQLSIDNIQPDEQQLRFLVHVDVPADVEFDKQIWQNGLQIFVGHSRGRVLFRAQFALAGSLQGSAGMGLTLCGSSIRCGYFVAEHVNGVGGDLARMSGGNFQRTFGNYQTRFEKDVMTRLSGAVLGASASSEASLSLARLNEALVNQKTQGMVVSRMEMPQMPEPSGGVAMCATPMLILQPGAAFSLDILLNGHRTQPAPPVTRPSGHARAAAFTGFLVDMGSSVLSAHSGGGGESSSSHSESHSESGHSDHHKK